MAEPSYTFRKVPAHTRPQYKSLLWRVVFHPVALHHPPLALELQGDVLMGVSQENGTPIDIDFGMWNGRQLGVSRRHLILRPSINKLYAVDLGSTNGTYVNGLPLGRSWAYGLKDDDILALGKLNLRLQVIKKPSD